ncbi:MAG: SDR family NAD(P)-dependent oxidoreductase [Candidatus Poribacteria bacterium]
MEIKSKTVLVTGCAGFIGEKISELLLEQGKVVVGIDNINDAYSPILKEWRLEKLKKFNNFSFNKLDIIKFDELKEVFQQNKFDAVMNLAARAGVRASVDNPWVYVDTNITGTLNLLELSKDFGVKKFVLASTSSIYGANKTPFSEDDKADKQLSPYASTKKGAEALAYTYHYLYGIDITVPRYFTVYGPAGRPDMMPFKFIHHIAEGIPIPVYGDGNQERDFTYIDDIARGSILCLKPLGYEVINLGSDRPVKVNYVIQLMEQYLGKKAIIEYQPAHSADVPATWANISKAAELLSWNSTVSIEEGIQNAVNWYLENRGWIMNIRRGS